MFDEVSWITLRGKQCRNAWDGEELFEGDVGVQQS